MLAVPELGYYGINACLKDGETSRRIAEAKRLTERLVDHAHYLLDISENNAIVLYSDQLSKQIPRSYAANAFNVFSGGAASKSNS